MGVRGIGIVDDWNADVLAVWDRGLYCIYHAGKWAEVVPTTVKLMFGSIEVKCDKINHIAKTATDEFTKDQIWEFLIWWINKPDQLKGKNNNYCFKCSEFTFKLGTAYGTLLELQKIYDAIK